MSRIGRLVNPSEDVAVEHLVLVAETKLSEKIQQTGAQVSVSPEQLPLFGDAPRLAERARRIGRDPRGRGHAELAEAKLD